MFYWIKTHWLVKKIFSKFIWDVPNIEKKVYLTFDDGPTPDVTAWVLSILKKHDAKATFFCIGDNIEKHPEIFQQILVDNHSVGNHTFNHINGWKTSTNIYLDNVLSCEIALNEAIGKSHEFSEEPIGNSQIFFDKHNNVNQSQLTDQKSGVKNQQSKITKLFRPPYGKIKPSQANVIRALGYKIVMWDVLSADFDNSISKEKCLKNVLKNVRSGSVIIFHDSQKAFKNLEYVLPKTMDFLIANGFSCDKII